MVRSGRLWLHASTILLGAFLLFQVQPILGKALLPAFGGAASVWTTCLLFFQCALVLGYAYAHWSARLKPRRQALLHCALLAASLALLPLAPSESWSAQGGAGPLLRILGLLTISAGLPYFLLSAASPLVQTWCARTRSAPVPYRLYAVSNLGSLAALASYPFLVEPYLATGTQEKLWSAAYVLFVVLCASAALMAARHPELQENGATEPAPGWKLRWVWMGLAAYPSALLLAVTTHITQNIAPVPLLWVLPLSLYLLSFILCFDRAGWYNPKLHRWLVTIALAGMCYAVLIEAGNPSAWFTLPTFNIGFFILCMFCHGELARRKPAAGHLTSFYLTVALGGAAGGAVVALVAPQVLDGNFELPILLAVCAIVMQLVYWKPGRPIAPWFGSTAVLVTACIGAIIIATSDTRVCVRNFFGELRVRDRAGSVEGQVVRTLLNGTVVHGAEVLSPGPPEPTTYYGPQSGAALAIEQVPSPRRIGVIGLGAGTLAAYARPGDCYRFYEINPLVVRLAKTQFSFLRDCPAKVDVVLGDARLSLEHEPPQRFDVLAVDAFSGDSVPVHLLTRQAFELYLRHLRPEGVLALHLTNRYLNLAPVAAAAAGRLGLQAVLVKNPKDPEHAVNESTWAVLAKDPALLSGPQWRAAEPLRPRRGFRIWTDDYSNLLQVLR